LRSGQAGYRGGRLYRDLSRVTEATPLHAGALILAEQALRTGYQPPKE
jgi:hypothetical protein